MVESTKKARNFIMTKNNPKESLTEFFEILKRDAVCACVQLERGETGTPHFQAFVSYKNGRHPTKMRIPPYLALWHFVLVIMIINEVPKIFLYISLTE